MVINLCSNTAIRI